MNPLQRGQDRELSDIRGFPYLSLFDMNNIECLNLARCSLKCSSLLFSRSLFLIFIDLLIIGKYTIHIDLLSAIIFKQNMS